MKRSYVLVVLWLQVVVAVFLGGTGSSAQVKTTSADPDLVRFTQEKRDLVKRLAEKYELSVLKSVGEFFEAVLRQDWPATTNLFEQLRSPLRNTEGVARHLWGPILETFGVYEQFPSWNPQLLRLWGNTIVTNIPPGSIYIGGTDAGRFVVSALCRSHTAGEPFFTITQNGLSDISYLEYLQDMYGKQFYVPGTNESQNAFNEYLKGAQERLRRNKILEGEDVRIVDNRVVIKGTYAVMQINENLVKVIVEENLERKIYLEESYPLESLYAQSTPHGLIFQVHHQKLEELSEQVLNDNRRFWAGQTKSLIGFVVESNMGLADLCAWAERVYVRSNLSAFEGNRAYAKDIQAQQYFSKCRTAQASFFEWHSAQAHEKARTTQLDSEADLAYRQAFALFPFYPETVWRFAKFLEAHGRTADLKLLLATALKANPTVPVETGEAVLESSRKKIRAKAEELGIGR